MVTSKQTITISASVLKWARRTLFGAKIDEAAGKLKITALQLQNWEINNPTITVTQLKRLSKVYKRHISVLLLTDPPVSQQPPKFRKLPDFDKATLDQATFLAIRQAQEIQNRTVFLLQDKENALLNSTRKYINQSLILALKISSLLNINEKTRFKTRNSRDQLVVWKRLLEGAGILVLELSFPLGDSRAFAIYNKVAPVIVLNSKDADNARIFSLFHELGHIILGQTDIDDELNLDLRQNNTIEIFCNDFAARILAPSELLKIEVEKISNFDDDSIKSVANIFKVSSAVIWRRLRDEKYITITQFDRIKHRLSTFEPYAAYGTKREFFANKNTYLYTTIKRKSEFYLSEVFEAFNQKRISYYDVINYIGIKSNYVTRLQKLMYM